MPAFFTLLDRIPSKMREVRDTMRNDLFHLNRETDPSAAAVVRSEPIIRGIPKGIAGG